MLEGNVNYPAINTARTKYFPLPSISLPQGTCRAQPVMGTGLVQVQDTFGVLKALKSLSGWHCARSGSGIKQWGTKHIHGQS